MTGVSRSGDSPFAQFELVEVVFTTSAVPTAISHHLIHVPPQEVRYLVVGQTAAGSVYESDRAEWSSNQLVLAASAPMIVTLLIVGVREETDHGRRS